MQYRYYLGNISSNFLWTSNYKRFKSLTKKEIQKNIGALINILTIVHLPCTDTHMSTKVFKYSPEYSIPSVRRHHQFWHTLQSVEWFSQDALQICGLLDDYNIQKTRGSTRGNFLVEGKRKREHVGKARDPKSWLSDAWNLQIYWSNKVQLWKIFLTTMSPYIGCMFLLLNGFRFSSVQRLMHQWVQ